MNDRIRYMERGQVVGLRIGKDQDFSAGVSIFEAGLSPSSISSTPVNGGKSIDFRYSTFDIGKGSLNFEANSLYFEIFFRADRDRDNKNDYGSTGVSVGVKSD